MKKIISFVAFFTLLTGLSYAQVDSAPSDAPNDGGALLKFESVVIDYGDIEQGSEPLRVFTFENVGTEPAIIKNAKGSCGCTVPVWPKEPIMMGEKSQIEVRYDTKRIGKFTKTVKLTTNYSDSPIVLTIKGNVNKKEEEPEGIPESTPSILNGGK